MKSRNIIILLSLALLFCVAPIITQAQEDVGIPANSEETLNEETLNEETLNEETLNEETLNEETLDEESLKKENTTEDNSSKNVDAVPIEELNRENQPNNNSQQNNNRPNQSGGLGNIGTTFQPGAFSQNTGAQNLSAMLTAMGYATNDPVFGNLTGRLLESYGFIYHVAMVLGGIAYLSLAMMSFFGKFEWGRFWTISGAYLLLGLSTQLIQFLSGQ